MNRTNGFGFCPVKDFAFILHILIITVKLKFFW
jgi:hypothetical protein